MIDIKGRAGMEAFSGLTLPGTEGFLFWKLGFTSNGLQWQNEKTHKSFRYLIPERMLDKKILL